MTAMGTIDSGWRLVICSHTPGGELLASTRCATRADCRTLARIVKRQGLRMRRSGRLVTVIEKREISSVIMVGPPGSASRGRGGKKRGRR